MCVGSRGREGDGRELEVARHDLVVDRRVHIALAFAVAFARAQGPLGGVLGLVPVVLVVRVRDARGEPGAEEPGGDRRAVVPAAAVAVAIVARVERLAGLGARCALGGSRAAGRGREDAARVVRLGDVGVVVCGGEGAAALIVVVAEARDVAAPGAHHADAGGAGVGGRAAAEGHEAGEGEGGVAGERGARLEGVVLELALRAQLAALVQREAARGEEDGEHEGERDGVGGGGRGHAGLGEGGGGLGGGGLEVRVGHGGGGGGGGGR